MNKNKTRQLIREITRVRNVNQAQQLVEKRRQGKMTDTVVHSAKIIGVRFGK